MNITNTELARLIVIRAKGLESASLNGTCDVNTKKGCENTIEWIKFIKEAIAELEHKIEEYSLEGNKK